MKFLQFVVSLIAPLIIADILKVPFVGLADISSLLYWCTGSIAIYATWSGIDSIIKYGFLRTVSRFTEIEV